MFSKSSAYKSNPPASDLEFSVDNTTQDGEWAKAIVLLYKDGEQVGAVNCQVLLKDSAESNGKKPEDADYAQALCQSAEYSIFFGKIREFILFRWLNWFVTARDVENMTAASYQAPRYPDFGHAYAQMLKDFNTKGVELRENHLRNWGWYYKKL